jgi:hypothetical protein
VAISAAPVNPLATDRKSFETFMMVLRFEVIATPIAGAGKEIYPA